MSPRTSAIFLHELRTALWESRWIAPIPAILFLFSLLIQQYMLKSDAAASTPELLRDFLNQVWPFLGWSIPYLILKKTDLQDINASWRSTPMPTGIIYGSRLLLAAIFTVAAPALIIGLSCRITNPDATWEQTWLTAAYQWAYLWIGACAAFAARGHRGLFHLAIAVVGFIAGGIALGCFINMNNTPSIEAAIENHIKHNGLLLPWLIISCLAPLAAIHRICQPGRIAKWHLWPVGTFLILPGWFGIMTMDLPRPKPTHAFHDTILTMNKPLHAKLFPCKRTMNGIAYEDSSTCIAEASISFENEFSDYIISDNFALGRWDNSTLSGRLGEHDWSNHPRLEIATGAGTGGITYISTIIGTDDSTSIAISKYTPQESEIDLAGIQWRSRRDRTTIDANGKYDHTSTNDWNGINDTRWVRTISLRFEIPSAIDAKQSIQPAAFRETTSINATIPAKKISSSKILMVTKLDQQAQYAKNGLHIKTIQKTRDNALIALNISEHKPIENAFHNPQKDTKHRTKTFRAALINTRRNQGIILASDTGQENMLNKTCNLQLPYNIEPPSPDWMKDAKLVLIEINYGPEIGIPVKLTAQDHSNPAS